MPVMTLANLYVNSFVFIFLLTQQFSETVNTAHFRSEHIIGIKTLSPPPKQGSGVIIGKLSFKT